ncbi:hypothetical protein CR159_19430 [Pollutimonas subterranea]|uniref:Inner membrane protein YedI n=1 Tax=Pollutimonas subterranea TaxID=2045210 RepID=A0A2N4TZH3_9BURK|nr:DUF808 domain-containing protein [Pollutimonas subterranea]PLC48170.1 hypothetical protein CR159_19430 [Pollutimonas subterranea]
MAGASLLTLLDDIASVLDDVALLTKAASKKTAGVLGDDIALNAQQVSGVVAKRELPVVWAVAKGSFVNKLIIVPAALAISAFVPQAITPLLMLGGIYLCYEGVEKVVHSLLHPQDKAHLVVPGAPPPADITKAFDTSGPTPEETKIKGAIRTDFILSAEIIAITLGTVASAVFSTQALVVASVALIMTVGVYGFVAAVVKLDDAGLYLSQRHGDGVLHKATRGVGVAILSVAPYLMKTLSIVGTIAMFLVGGGILMHGIPGAETYSHDLVHSATSGLAGALGSTINWVAPTLINALVGIIAGGIALVLVKLVQRILGRSNKSGGSNEAPH